MKPAISKIKPWNLFLFSTMYVGINDNINNNNIGQHNIHLEIGIHSDNNNNINKNLNFETGNLATSENLATDNFATGNLATENLATGNLANNLIHETTQSVNNLNLGNNENLLLHESSHAIPNELNMVADNQVTTTNQGNHHGIVVSHGDSVLHRINHPINMVAGTTFNNGILDETLQANGRLHGVAPVKNGLLHGGAPVNNINFETVQQGNGLLHGVANSVNDVNVEVEGNHLLHEGNNSNNLNIFDWANNLMVKIKHRRFILKI